MDEEEIKRVIDKYEEKLQKRDKDFTLSDFERMIMEESMKYGYEYCLNEMMK